MTIRVTKTRDELRAELPELAALVDALRAECGPGVRVMGIRTQEWTMGNPDVPAGIRLSQCAWDPPQPAADAAPADRSKRRRRRA